MTTAVQISSNTPGFGPGFDHDASHFMSSDAHNITASAGHLIETSNLRSSPHPVQGDISNGVFDFAQSLPSSSPMQDRNTGVKEEQLDLASLQARTGFLNSYTHELKAAAALEPSVDARLPISGLQQQPGSQESAANPASLDATSVDDVGTLDPAEPIRAFAKLDFPDGIFFIKTHTIELGRDLETEKRAKEQYLHSQLSASPDTEDASPFGRRRDISNGGGSRPHSSHARGRRSRPQSAASEEGGFFSRDRQSTERKLRKLGQAMSKSSSAEGSSRSSNDPSSPLRGLTNSHRGLGKNFEEGLDTSQAGERYPLIPIHPPSSQIEVRGAVGGISRRHLRISFNFQTRTWEGRVLGRNGCFVNDVHYVGGDTIQLYTGDMIQISAIQIRFSTPEGQAKAETIASETFSGMSLDFENGIGDTVNPESPSLTSPTTLGDQESDADEADGDADSDGGVDIAGETLPAHAHPASKKMVPSSSKHLDNKKQSTKPKVNGPADSKSKDKEPPKFEERREIPEGLDLGIPLNMIPPRKKGPGRPPKNGFMSKREQAEIVRRMKEEKKQQAALENGTVQPSNDKDKEKDASETRPEKRKYTRRKKPEEQGEENGELRNSIEGADESNSNEAPAQEKVPRDKKPPKPPKSLSPEIRKEDYTEEQLAKPSHSYVVLIHEALSSAKNGQMALPQIYKAIERKYPYYKFGVKTPGWQSSVRHNLSGHAAFKKVARDGKGWLWGIDEKVSIDKEKRKRPSPPPVQQPPTAYYPNPPPMHHPMQHMHPFVPAMINGHALHPTPQNAFQYPFPPPNGLAAPPPFGTVPVTFPPPQLKMDSGETYRSPYASLPGAQLPPPATQSDSITTNGQLQQRPQKQSAMSENMQASAEDGSRAGQNGAARLHTEPPPVSSNTPELPPTIPERFLHIVHRFSDALKRSLSSPNADEIVNNAVNRTLGLPLASPEEPETAEELAIRKALLKMFKQLDQRDRQHSESTPPEPRQNTRLSVASDQSAVTPAQPQTSLTTTEDNRIQPSIQGPQEQSGSEIQPDTIPLVPALASSPPLSEGQRAGLLTLISSLNASQNRNQTPAPNDASGNSTSNSDSGPILGSGQVPDSSTPVASASLGAELSQINHGPRTRKRSFEDAAVSQESSRQSKRVIRDHES